MNDVASWYVVKQTSGQCVIVPANQVEAPANQVEAQPAGSLPRLDRWGPYDSQQKAIAHRVGLIRAGKCQPV